MPQPDAPFGGDPIARAVARSREQLSAIRDRMEVEYFRRRLMRRLFGDPDNPTRDGRLFFLLLADMAAMGATRIAESDREETARAANRAMVNRLIAAWDGDDETLMRLRARERELTEETE
ncbi:hypothetical protein [Sphingopyxis sp. SCN 67-31]|uniref:hypothetical protein n=1 Tax=Sphingopyxis sp. SCN 67-31 TaxID=1660142 RepID=UPI00086A6D40|nr:hypothetical protein [Sphingopyxis sp. SCN 67-31]ODU28995.1 MAG: hypothetical protein ABS88_10720 [Sphingopyxis sp. SCN 67-31]